MADKKNPPPQGIAVNAERQPPADKSTALFAKDARQIQNLATRVSDTHKVPPPPPKK